MSKANTRCPDYILLYRIMMLYSIQFVWWLHRKIRRVQSGNHRRCLHGGQWSSGSERECARISNLPSCPRPSTADERFPCSLLISEGRRCPDSNWNTFRLDFSNMRERLFKHEGKTNLRLNHNIKKVHHLLLMFCPDFESLYDIMMLYYIFI